MDGDTSQTRFSIYLVKAKTIDKEYQVRNNTSSSSTKSLSLVLTLSDLLLMLDLNLTEHEEDTSCIFLSLVSWAPPSYQGLVGALEHDFYFSIYWG